MKAIYKIGILTVGMGTIFFATAGAQEFKTDESIRTQLKNGTVSGFKYGPDKKKVQTNETTPKHKEYKKGDFKSSLSEDGSSSGSSSESGAARSFKSTGASAKTTAGTLSSDAPVPAKADRKEIVVPKPPTQGEEKKTD